LQQSLQLNRSTCGHRACETEQLVQANDEKMSKKSTLSEFSENVERSEMLFRLALLEYEALRRLVPAR
jgi:hypothetical protein